MDMLYLPSSPTNGQDSSRCKCEWSSAFRNSQRTENFEYLEKQLISLRIPFMKLVQLPKGNQRGIIGPCVSIPTDIQKTVNILPRCDDETQLVRCKLKRKQSYIGYSQYGFVSTKKISEALECLKEVNPYYKDTSLNHAWHDGFPVDFADITQQRKIIKTVLKY
ncbi:unnamed protein product [Mytilus edulis]|uniref:DUF6570 domain-containing protein n=1 Tax=Mytilus edulis TaxID=6550 RepID=A0A8S3RWE7_MYTED|nr:unnamed protein product [Mytilus edulis]